MSRRLATCAALVFLLSLSVRLFAEEPAEQVRKMEEKWAQAYKERNIDILSTLLSREGQVQSQEVRIPRPLHRRVGESRQQLARPLIPLQRADEVNLRSSRSCSVNCAVNQMPGSESDYSAATAWRVECG